MSRILCIWLPDWPIQRLCHVRPEWKQEPLVLYEERRGLRIVACSALARARGIKPGMTVAEAIGVPLEKYDPIADLESLKALALWCDQFSPVVGLEEAAAPECLLLDITGVVPLGSGEEALVRQIARAFARRDLHVRLAVADTVSLAWALAHYFVMNGATEPRVGQEYFVCPSDQSLAILSQTTPALPVQALRIPEPIVQTLNELGVYQVAQLLAIPIASLAARFDRELVVRIQQALGIQPEPIVPYRVPAEVVYEQSPEYPLEDLASIEHFLTQMIQRACCVLMERQQGVLQFECVLRCESGDCSRFMIGLFRASAQPEHLFQLLQMRLERWILRSPVRSLELAIKLTAPLQIHQRGLFGDPYDHQQQLSLLIDRLSSRLQREAVVYAIPVSDAQPEYAYRYAPLTGSHSRLSARKKPSGKKSPSLLLPPTDLIDGSEAPHEKALHEKAPLAHLIRPVLLELTPLPLEVLTTTRDGIPLRFRVHRELYERHRVWGPERIQTGWWRHKYIRRDYYRIETTTGNRFWLFCSKRRWYLHGVFD